MNHRVGSTIASKITRHKHVLTYGISFGVCMLVILSRTVSDAILNFFIAGMVPGTDIILSPDTMLILIVSLLSLACLSLIAVLIYQYIFGVPKFPHGGNKPDAAQVSALQTSVKTKKTHTAAKLAGTQNKTRLLRWFRYVRRVFNALIGYIEGIWRIVTRLFIVTGVMGILVAEKLFYGLRRIALTTWTHLEPFLLSLDTWLEIRTRTALAFCKTRFIRTTVYMTLMNTYVPRTMLFSKRIGQRARDFIGKISLRK